MLTTIPQMLHSIDPFGRDQAGAASPLIQSFQLGGYSSSDRCPCDFSLPGVATTEARDLGSTSRSKAKKGMQERFPGAADELDRALRPL
jgi:hypothetical protein